ncbi:alpha/beta hydrolase [Persicirhabdus sediminis]|uniref:Alpha/beta hydrolase n=1 Tax=Persicirhabdus sediminis TaxID=454144 RepID=A0A8J7MBB1_9BACT|nr:alpha/beta hydrolase [Persicirhabdus sediminis]MBK1790277.1 alpha/beta hydrolase [Persicirhabdus sediminis]
MNSPHSSCGQAKNKPLLHRFNKSWIRAGAMILLTLSVSSCGRGDLTTLNLMPAPAAFTETGLQIKESTKEKILHENSILYATDREPADKNSKQSYYKNSRGNVLRLGEAEVGLQDTLLTLNDLYDVSLLKDRSEKYPIGVDSVDEFGVLKESVTPLHTRPKSFDVDADIAGRTFANKVNNKLHRSDHKDIYLYVHGYKVTFENPILIAAELWHFTGYEGVFVAYSWPATPKALAYIGDSETASYSAHNFRIFLNYLASSTDARRIHIISYSAGTRMVVDALGDMALQTQHLSASQRKSQLKLGNVVLMASDVDRGIFAGKIADGADQIVDHLIVYQNSRDKALSIPEMLNGRRRLGQALPDDNISDEVHRYIRNSKSLQFVDVSKAAFSTKANGHGYLRASPWVSSDILIATSTNMSPAERGLVRSDDDTTWSFPSDYISRLKGALLKINPDLEDTSE